MGNCGIVLVHAADALYACGRLSIEQCSAKAFRPKADEALSGVNHVQHDDAGCAKPLEGEAAAVQRQLF
jgi:hypothetical protein